MKKSVKKEMRKISLRSKVELCFGQVVCRFTEW